MDDEKNKRPVRPWQQAGPTSVEFPRRRLGRIVHDERGQASMEWERVEPDERGTSPRLALSLVDDPAPTARSLRLSSANQGVDPYDRGIETTAERAVHPRRRPGDLRQLDAWIRQRRAVEANRRSEDD
jgi:hypothetical protein